MGKKAVLNHLKDPETARFRNLTTSRNTFLCGEVNAKNSMGGYVGFVRFMAIGEANIVTFESEEVPTFTERWLTNCEGVSEEQVERAKAKLEKK